MGISGLRTQRPWRSMIETDVLVIGSGAGGGPLAFDLSSRGAEVLVLEKGERLSNQQYRHDELTNHGLFVPSLNDDPHTVLHQGREAAERTQLGWIASCVGGGTAHMGAYLYRFHPDDFRMVERFGAYEELADWPFTYGEIEPYYARAEWEIGVAGRAGANPFEGPRSVPYPMPPLVAHPMADVFDAACARLSLTAFPTPRGVNSVAYAGRPACSYCTSCAGYGCPTGARGTSQVSLIDRAEKTGRCTIRPRAMVREITVGPRGEANGCVFLDDANREHEVRARIVCVCCSAVESARLLMLSKSSRFPNGLANGNGQVGRSLQFHGVSLGHARFHHHHIQDPRLLDRHPVFGRSVMDYYFLPGGVSDLPKGGVLRFGRPSAGPITVAKGLAHENGSVSWGRELKEKLRAYYHDYLTIEFEVFHDFIPNSRTFVDLDPEVRDRFDLPVARIHLDRCQHQVTSGRWLIARGLEILEETGADELHAGHAGGTARFLVHGTCRSGDDPEKSVLNRFCETHEVPNLFVVDGSFMPTSGGAAPTLTILANSFRVADHIFRRAKGH